MNSFRQTRMLNCTMNNCLSRGISHSRRCSWRFGHQGWWRPTGSCKVCSCPTYIPNPVQFRDYGAAIVLTSPAKSKKCMNRSTRNARGLSFCYKKSIFPADLPLFAVTVTVTLASSCEGIPRSSRLPPHAESPLIVVSQTSFVIFTCFTGSPST